MLSHWWETFNLGIFSQDDARLQNITLRYKILCIVFWEVDWAAWDTSSVFCSIIDIALPELLRGIMWRRVSDIADFDSASLLQQIKKTLQMMDKTVHKITC